VKGRGQFRVRLCDAAKTDVHSFSGRENDIVQLELFDLFDDFPGLIAQAGLPAHLSEALPQDIGQEADQDVSLDTPLFLMPDGAQPEVVFFNAERVLGIGQLNVGCPEIFRRPIFDIAAQDVAALAAASPGQLFVPPSPTRTERRLIAA
jgi:hypothetical protein